MEFVEVALKLVGPYLQSDPLAWFYAPKETFGAPAEPILLAGTLVGLAVFMFVLSFLFESCFRGGFLGRFVFGALAAATVAVSFFILIVLFQGAVKVTLCCLSKNVLGSNFVLNKVLIAILQHKQPLELNDFLISLAGACTAGMVSCAIVFVCLGKLLAVAFG
jgi:hypothetical protein